jgi:hypothetical protein
LASLKETVVWGESALACQGGDGGFEEDMLAGIKV